mmetsp:Transcript_1203/g.1251  ORF Transcript_1203/g.1251 Transcript_1203/m.1251 type:complete len:125 (-) Transcript_1203:207-581(-)
MNVIAEINSDHSVTSKNGSSVHLLPCSIDYSGPAPVGTYFLINEKANEELHAQFRGRELKGKVVSLPADVCGLSLSSSSLGENKVDVQGHFNSFTLWEHDVMPSEESLTEYFNWFKISKSIHEI